jgi:carboxymethylenebutenolidase
MHSIHRPLEPREGRGAVTGEMISFGKRRDAGTGYMARSERVGPGVVLLHEFFGLTDSFKQMADDLNAAGFTVLAPDLYDGVIAETVEEASSMSDDLDVDRVLRQLGAATEHLSANWHPRVGVVGFSLGAWYALKLAQQRSLEAVVTYYGVAMIDIPAWKTPLLAHLAEVDEWTPPEDVAETIGKLDDEIAELHTYPGTGHWFANPGVPDAFDPEAAATAWSRTVDFLTHHLA